MRFKRFQSGDTTKQDKKSSFLHYTFHLSSHRFPMEQHNVLNRSTVSQTQTQTAIVCLLMTRVSPDDMSVSFSSSSPPSFSSQSRLSCFSSFPELMCLWLPHFHLYVFILSVFFSPFPVFSLQGGHMVDRQTDGG